MTGLSFSKLRHFIIVIALLVLASGVGYRLGERQAKVEFSPDKRVIINQTPPPSAAVDFSLFWDVWQRLFRYYLDARLLDPQKMVYGAISGMVNALDDPYTVFLPPKENSEFKEDLGGAFDGIGAQLGLKDNRVIIVAPLKNSPAEKAGILAGDLITKVDSEDTIGWTVARAVAKIRGPRGTLVTLTIAREKQPNPVDITVKRDTITVPSVTEWVKDVSQISEISGLPNAVGMTKKSGKIAYLGLSRFGDRTNDEWDKAVVALLAAEKADGNLKGLVFDLRNNPGGYLEGSVFIASEFVRSGTIVTQVNSDGTRDNYTVDRQGKLLDIPLMVLVNRGSASAAEIVAGAIRDNKRGTIVGETTFGKGSVQTPQELAGGAGLHITTGKWLLPSGDSINKKGVAPDVVVTMENATATTDAQLAKAVELLLK